MYHLLFYSYVEDILEKRGPYREEHLAGARAMHERGALVMVGAYAEPTDGALFVFKTEDRAVIEAFVASDPYVKAGLVSEWKIRPWTVVLGG
jgi:uncharacterized protein YciI